MWRIKAASGQAAAKARRTREVISTTRAPSLKAASEWCRTRPWRAVGLGDCITQREHQPVGGGVQDQPHLVGERAAAAGAVGGELSFVQFDQVLGLAAGAVEGLIDMLGRAGVEAGDDKANVEPLCRRFDAGAGAALALPRLGLVAGLGEAAQGGLLVEGTAGADVVGGRLDGTSQYRIAGQTEDEIDAVFFAPRHHLRAAVMAVAANGQVGVRPVFAEAADEAA